jgi:regulator of RNase E activity RraB
LKVCKSALVDHSKVVWRVTSAELSFIKDKNEWTGTDIIFDITHEGGQTHVSLTHVGLTPQVECYSACLEGWGHYFSGSLKQLIESGTGTPDPEDYSKKSG